MQSLFVWTPWGLLGTTGSVVALAAAVVVWRTTRHPGTRTRFTLLLAAESVMMLTAIGGPMQWMLHESWVRFVFKAHLLNDCLLVAIYLPAISLAVDSPMVKWFRTRPGQYVPGIVGGVLFVAILIAPDSLGGGAQKGIPGYGSLYTGYPGPLNAIVFICLVLSYLWGLVSAVHAWRNAKSDITRRKNGALATAFGARDISWGALYVFGAVVSFTDPGDQTELLQTGLAALPYFFLLYLVYIAACSYAIAYYNILDIDLKVKKTLKRSTVGAAFVALFYIVSEGTANLLSAELGPVLALVATAALLFFLAPLQDFADRLANRAMPSVQDTPEYQKFRRLQIYGAAIEDIVRTGPISVAQRAVLDRLRVELELETEEALALEAEIGPAPSAA